MTDIDTKTVDASELLQFTEGARERIRSFIEEDDAARLAVRVSVRNSSPVAPEYEMALVEPDERNPDDVAFDAGGFEAVVDADSVDFLSGTRIDWVETLRGSGFQFENPNLKPLGSEALTGPLVDRVQQVLADRVNPMIASHGGAVSLVDIRDGVAYVRMQGGCQGCGMASVTLTQGVKQMIQDAIPEITDVEDVTNHAAGENPYYS